MTDPDPLSRTLVEEFDRSARAEERAPEVTENEYIVRLYERGLQGFQDLGYVGS
ncbi:hypothetical protein HRbin27_01176 [bacterium HR27]|nr:hypothetical protein HRbin27_01176 [bacterium HR27]